MAVDITGKTIMLPLINKVENQDIHGKNWAVEVVELTIGTNTSTTYTLNTSTTAWPVATTATGPLHISTPLFVTCDGFDDTSTGYKVTYAPGSVVITWAVAPTGAMNIRVKIEGWA